MTAGTRPHPTTGRQLRRLLATAAQAVVVGGVLATTVVVLLRPVVLTVPMPGAAPGPAGLVVSAPAGAAGGVAPATAVGATTGAVYTELDVTNHGHSSVPGFDASVVVTGRPATVTAVAACPRPWTVGTGDTSPCAAGARQVGDPAAGMSPAGAGDVVPVRADTVLPPGGALYLRLTVAPAAAAGTGGTAVGATTVVHMDLADT